MDFQWFSVYGRALKRVHEEESIPVRDAGVRVRLRQRV